MFFPSCQKCVCLCLFRFCHFPSVSISFNKISRFLCLILFVFQHFLKTNSFFSGHLISFLVFLAHKKISLFKFPFWSSSFLYLCLSFLFLSVTLFMFQLLCMYPPDVPSLFVHPPHCYSPFFVAKHFFQKKNSPFHCCKTFVLQSPLSFPLFISFWNTLQFFFSFLVSSFFFDAFFLSWSFEKKISHQKKSFSNISKIVLLNFLSVYRKISKIFPSTFIFWFFWTFEKMYFSLLFFLKNIPFF